MHSVQSASKQTNLSRRQRRRHRYSAASAAAAAAASSSTSSSSYTLPRYCCCCCYKVAKAYRNTIPIVHGIVVSHISLVLLQKEYIEQFYFEKRSGGGGPEEPDKDRHMLLPNAGIQLLRFG